MVRSKLGGLTGDNVFQSFEPEDDEQVEQTADPSQKARMIDWLQCIKLPVGLVFSPIIVCIAVVVFTQIAPQTLSESQQSTIFTCSLLLALLGPIALITQLRGTIFDASKDLLVFPRYILRRKFDCPKPRCQLPDHYQACLSNHEHDHWFGFCRADQRARNHQTLHREFVW
jgi:hypothetical protein